MTEVFRDIHGRLKAYGGVECVISGCGILVLAAAYLYWFVAEDAGPVGRLAALLSIALFIWMCLRFVPVWVSAWRVNGLEVQADAERESAAELLKIFALLLLFCLGMTLLVWLIRLLQGHSESYYESLFYWTYTDSHHYIDIARDGYISAADVPGLIETGVFADESAAMDRLVQLVFLPGYPAAIGLMYLLVRDYVAAAFLVSALSFSGAGCLLYKLFRLDFGRETARRAIVFLCALPGSFFFAAPMSESLFLLCSAGCVYLVRRGKYGLGCLLGAYAAFTRSLGLMLFVPVFFELVNAYLRGGKRRGTLACFFWLLLIPAGFGAYCYINYRVSGDPFKYMEYQSEHWGQNFGFFFGTAAYQLENAIKYLSEGRATVWGLWIPNLLWSFFALAIMIPAARRLRPGYTAWFIAYYAVAIGATWLLSAPRYLVAMPVIPLALALTADSHKKELTALAISIPLAAAYLLAFTIGLQVW